MISCGFTVQWPRGMWEGMAHCLLYCLNQALVGEICELMRMKVSQPWQGSRQSLGRHCANFPRASPGADSLQDEWGPWASLLAQPSTAHVSQSHGGWVSGLPIIVALPPSNPLSLKRRRYCSLFQSSFYPDLHQAGYFGPGNPKAAGLSSFVVFTHVPLGPSWAVKNKALERQMVSGGGGEGKGRREEA